MTNRMDASQPQINKKIIYGILLLGVGIYVLFNTLDEDTVSVIVFPLSVLFSSGVSVMAFFVSKKYWGTEIFGKAYLLLGIGYLSYTIAEITYYTLDILGHETYPSIADVFFFMLYPPIFIYLVLNIRFFKVKITKLQKIWGSAIPILALTAYVTLSLLVADTEMNFDFDFWFGFGFVTAASVVLSLSVLCASIVKQSMFGVILLLLTVGIFLNAVGDVWYYHLEVFGLFTDSHLVNIVWHVSNMIMVFGLYTHYFKFKKS